MFLLEWALFRFSSVSLDFKFGRRIWLKYWSSTFPTFRSYVHFDCLVHFLNFGWLWWMLLYGYLLLRLIKVLIRNLTFIHFIWQLLDQLLRLLWYLIPFQYTLKVISFFNCNQLLLQITVVGPLLGRACLNVSKHCIKLRF